VAASSQSANYFGGDARLPRQSEGTHDLFLTSVYARFLRSRPDEVKHWVGECRLAKEASGKEGVIPDALIRRGEQNTAVEVVGESYTASKLQAFHEHCVRSNWSYEIW
jgi:hypothetical protein